MSVRDVAERLPYRLLERRSPEDDGDGELPKRPLQIFG